MSTEAPNVNSGETNNPDLLAEQSGMPNMSSTKTFTVDTNMQVNGDLDVTGTVTATSFIGDGSQLTGISGGTGGGLDSAAVTLLVDSDYVQARETPQDFAYSSLTGAPTALSSFTNDTSYITAADIPTTVDSAYVQSRVTLDGVGLDSAGVTALVDSDYVALRAPAASGGLDSAAVQGVVDDNLLGGVANTGVVIGPSASADTSKLQMTVVGPSAFTNGAYNVAVGRSASVQSGEEFAVAIGNQARAGYSTGGLGGVSIGNQSTVQYDNGVAVGMNAEVKGIRGVALGFDAEVRDTNAIAIGYGPLVLNGQNSISVGRGIIDADNAISISATGAQTTLSGQYSIDIRTSDSGSAVYSIDSDWQFGATVNAPAFVGDGSGLTNLPSGGGLDSAATIALIGMQNKPAGSNAIQITPDTSTLNGDNNNIIIGTQISDMAGIGPQAVAMGYDIGAQANGVSIGYQAGAGSQSTNTGGVFIGSRTNYFGNSNPADYAIAIGHEAGAVYPGVGSVALGKSAGAGSSGDYTVAIGYNANNTSSFNNTIMIKADGSSAHNSTAQYDIDIRTSAAGSLTYDTTNDWTFGAGVTMTDLTASGATVVFSNLPTTDPLNAGQLWNDAGTLKVSAG